MEFNQYFLRAEANEACRAFAQITGNDSILGCASPLCLMLGRAYYMGGEL